MDERSGLEWMLRSTVRSAGAAAEAMIVPSHKVDPAKKPGLTVTQDRIIALHEYERRKM